MRRISVTRTGFAACSILALLLPQQAASLASAPPPPAAPPTAAGAAAAKADSLTDVLIEFDGKPAAGDLAAPGTTSRRIADARARSDELRAQHATVLGRARTRGVDLNVADEMTTVFNGVVAEVPSARIDEIRTLPGVRAVHLDKTYQLTLDDSVPLVRAPEVWQHTAPDGKSATGHGVVVAVLDSGIDYRHPDLGGGFGEDRKVVTGYDFVNEDADPMDDRGHGTHVAGIVAGNGETKGVAPDAQLAAYKVTNRFGQGQLTDILPALDLAVAADNPHRADVVNLSLGGPGDGTDPLSVAAGRAVAAGAVVVASAGNDGPGSHSIGAPAASPDVVAVGASVSGIVVPRVEMVTQTRQSLRGERREFSAAAPSTAQVTQVVDIGTAEPGWQDGVDVAGKTVLVSDNGTALETAMTAEKNGAVAALFYIPDFWPHQPQSQRIPSARRPDGPEGPSHAFSLAHDGRLDSIVAMQVPGASAATLQRALADGGAEVEISGVDGTDLLADFSSRGPSDLFHAKPDLVAPGVEIRSTMPDGEHQRMSGTSMAAPHVAGAAALLSQLHPEHDAREIGAALTASAAPLELLKPTEQGAGRLDVLAASRSDVLPTQRSLSLGLADLTETSIDRSAEFGLRNVGATPVTAALAVQSSGTTGVEVDLAPDRLTLQPGASANAILEVQGRLPASDEDVSGWVTVDLHEDGSVDLRVPYLLAVRHLQMHVTPDPVLEDTQSLVYVRSPAQAASAPSLMVTCPGLDPQQRAMQPAGTSLWHASVRVADPGLCSAHAEMVAEERYGGVSLTGSVRFEVSPTVEQSPSAGHWKPIGPNAGEGLMVFDALDRDRMAVFPWGPASLFETEDGLQTWRQLKTMPTAGGSVAGAVAHPTDSGTMFAAINGGAADPTFQGRVLRTDDAGRTWRDLGHPDTRLAEIAVSPDGDSLAVGATGGAVRLRVGSDGDWQQLPGTRSVLQDMHWIGDDLYLTSTRGLEVVRNATGAQPETQVLIRPGVLGWAGEVAGDTETLLVTAYPFPQLFASTDGGATFHEAFRAPGSSFQDVQLVGEDVYAINTRGIYVGHDRAETWEQWGNPNPGSVNTNIGTWENSRPQLADTFYVGASGAGIYSTDQPGTFRRTGIPNADVSGLAAAHDDTGEVLIAGTFRDTFRTHPPGHEAVKPGDLEWESSGGEGRRGVSVAFLHTDPTDPTVVYKVTHDPALTFSVWRSTDAGMTWTRKTRISEFPSALLVHPANPDHLYAGYVSLTGTGLTISRDGGDTWHKFDQGHAFQTLAGDPTNPDRLWAGDYSGLYVSEDAGVFFRQISETPVTTIEVDPADPETLVVGGRQMSISRDGGLSMRATEHADLDMWVTDVVFSPTDPDTVYAASGPFFDELGILRNGRGVWRSTDGGKSWSSMTQGLDNTDVLSLAVAADGKHLFAGTLGGSVHRIKVTGQDDD